MSVVQIGEYSHINFKNVSVISSLEDTPNFTCLILNGVELNYDKRLFSKVIEKLPEYFFKLVDFDACFINLSHITHFNIHLVDEVFYNEVYFVNGRVLKWKSATRVDLQLNINEFNTKTNRLATEIDTLKNNIDVANLKYREIDTNLLEETMSILNDE